MNTSRVMRGSVIAFAAALLVSAGAAAASAEETPLDDQGVDVHVDVQPLTQPGVLAMSVAGTSANLTEDGSTDLVRQFTGTLPEVTVTDTRTADEIPDGAFWYVMGSASDFHGAGAASISAAHLGWSPRLVAGAGDPNVSEGGDVLTAMDKEIDNTPGRGLVDKELLFLGDAATAGGTWSANAALTLRVGADVAPGAYSSVLTLSLFE
jgi:hypothetical protein